MTDAERSVSMCLASFAEFHQGIRRSLLSGHDAKWRIAVHFSKGRVLNSQVTSTIDFTTTEDSPPKITEKQTEKATKITDEWFQGWHKDLISAIENRKEGWLRLMIAVNVGDAIAANASPAFDMKPT